MAEVKKPTVTATAKPVAPKPSVAKPAVTKSARPRLHEKYVKEVIPTMMKKYGFKNVMAVPKIEKVVINVGLGEYKDDTKKFENAVDEIAQITGQKPIWTRAKKSISNFKLRENQKIGAKVTLRGKKMYEFLDKLISIALPRVRDFRGISPTSFDKFGNYALGIKEQLVFPEISYEKIDKVRGFDICVVTTAKNNVDALTLLKEIGFPFRGGK
ncbi:MAG: 50S ribosomal protein L5 [Christensenellaceae bacterium]|jgi:large subunit ribosomal protein L5|nr:50S ribosomal protein L5 [Christensenellaceae bacterium]